MCCLLLIPQWSVVISQQQLSIIFCFWTDLQCIILVKGFTEADTKKTKRPPIRHMLCLDPPMIWESLIDGTFLWALAMVWHRWWAGRLRSLVPFPLLTTVPHWRAASLFLAPDAGPGPWPRLGNGLSWRVTCFCKRLQKHFFFLLFYLDLLRST